MIPRIIKCSVHSVKTIRDVRVLRDGVFQRLSDRWHLYTKVGNPEICGRSRKHRLEARLRASTSRREPRPLASLPRVSRPPSWAGAELAAATPTLTLDARLALLLFCRCSAGTPRLSHSWLLQIWLQSGLHRQLQIALAVNAQLAGFPVPLEILNIVSTCKL